jgi:hypothetical protein
LGVWKPLSLISTRNDENLLNDNKTKHPKLGRRKDKMDGPKSMQKEKTTNESGPQMEHEQIEYSNFP